MWGNQDTDLRRESVRTRRSSLVSSLDSSQKEPNLGGLNYPSGEPLYLNSEQKAYKTIHRVFNFYNLTQLRSLSWGLFHSS